MSARATSRPLQFFVIWHEGGTPYYVGDIETWERIARGKWGQPFHRPSRPPIVGFIKDNIAYIYDRIMRDAGVWPFRSCPAFGVPA